MALLRETKVLLWAKLVAKVFLLNMFCLLIVAKGNQGVFMALLRVTKALLRVKLVARR